MWDYLFKNTADYEHVSFDIWKTLIVSNPEFKKARVQAFADFFKLKQDLDTVKKKVRKWDLQCNRINEIVGGNLDTFEIYSLILMELCPESPYLNMKSFHEFYALNEKLFEMYPPKFIEDDLEIKLVKLRDKEKTLSLLSNTGFIKGTTMKKFFQREGIYKHFQFMVFSDQCRYSKPNKKIFELVHQHIIRFRDISKDSIIHVGDNYQADVLGARQYGFQSILFTY